MLQLSLKVWGALTSIAKCLLIKVYNKDEHLQYSSIKVLI